MLSDTGSSSGVRLATVTGCSHMTDDEPDLGDFETQVSDGDAEVEQITPAMLRSRSDYDREIRPGDPVRDLWGGGWLVVHDKKADTVAEYDSQQPDERKSLLEYEGSKAMGATEADAVYSCFYLNQNNTLAGGRSGPYDFPESRICRYAYEATDGFKKGRFQEVLRDLVLEQVVAASADVDHGDAPAIVLAAISKAFDTDAAVLAAELNDMQDFISGGEDG